MSEEPLAMRCLRHFSCPEEAHLPLPWSTGSRSGWKKFKRPAQAQAVGCRLIQYAKVRKVKMEIPAYESSTAPSS